MTENGLPALAGGYTPDDDIWWFSTAPDDMADPLNPVPGRQNLCESLIANASNAIISKTLQGIVTSWNPAAKEIFGYIAEEIIGRPLAMIIPASRRDEEAEILEKIRRGARIKNYETLVQRKNGELFPISVTVSPIRDADGKIIGAFRIVRDITEYMKALEILRSAEERYALALSGMRIGVWDWGLKAGKMFESERLRALIGPAPPEHVADCETFTGRIHQDDRQAVAERLRAHLEKREKFDVVYRMRVKDNQYVWVHTNGQAVWNESGTPVRMVGSIEDITQRHKLENNLVELVGKLKKSNKERDEFAYAASHDLKAPLRVIETTSQWLLEDLEPYLTQETRENMNLLRGRVIRMEKLLGDLLEYSRIGKAKDERFAQVVKGSELLDNIIELLSPDSGFSVLSDSGLAKIEVMRMPLQQVLMNLIDNAMKHHDKRTGTIKIGLEDIGPVYEFTVEDDGPGIPAEFHDKIFEMFRTLRPRDQVEGSGMGLAMVRKNVEMFGGSITVQSGPGRGSRFRFTWPKSQPAWTVDA